MNARLYALGWRVLPYVCLPTAAMLGFLLALLFGSAR